MDVVISHFESSSFLTWFSWLNFFNYQFILIDFLHHFFFSFIVDTDLIICNVVLFFRDSFFRFFVFSFLSQFLSCFLSVSLFSLVSFSFLEIFHVNWIWKWITDKLCKWNKPFRLKTVYILFFWVSVHIC